MCVAHAPHKKKSPHRNSCCDALGAAESAEFATSREEIEEDYRRRLREYKRKHRRAAAKAGTATATATAADAAAAQEATKDVDSVAKIQRQPTGVSEMSSKDDVEGQVREEGQGARACSLVGWRAGAAFVLVNTYHVVDACPAWMVFLRCPASRPHERTLHALVVSLE